MLSDVTKDPRLFCSLSSPILFLLICIIVRRDRKKRPVSPIPFTKKIKTFFRRPLTNLPVSHWPEDSCIVISNAKGGWEAEYLSEWKESIIIGIVDSSWIIHLMLNTKLGFGRKEEGKNGECCGVPCAVSEKWKWTKMIWFKMIVLILRKISFGKFVTRRSVPEIYSAITLFKDVNNSVSFPTSFSRTLALLNSPSFESGKAHDLIISNGMWQKWPCDFCC